MSLAPVTAGKLYVVATPIGNLGDLSPRAAAVLGEVTLVAAEDTRRAGKLFAPDAGRRKARMISLNAHNYAGRVPEILAVLAAGESVALVSDAGTPAISDPGGAVVAAAWQSGFPVVPVAGPSAVATALSVAGFPAERYLFAGYVPKKPGRRATYLDWIEQVGETAVIFETPHRMARTLAELAGRWPERQALIARELTKLHEELMRDTLSALATSNAARNWRGEITIVIAPPRRERRETDDSDV